MIHFESIFLDHLNLISGIPAKLLLLLEKDFRKTLNDLAVPGGCGIRNS